MSLNGALHIGRTAIMASQTALQVTGNNMANAATPGYHRQTVHFTPLPGQQLDPRTYVGLGVAVAGVRREVDVALQARLRSAIADEHGAMIERQVLGSLESIQNELTGYDLSSALATFLNGFSEAANDPQSDAARALAIQQGVSLASFIQSMRSDYMRTVDRIDSDLSASITSVNGLLDRVAALNVEVTSAEAGGAVASSLRDERDMVLDEIASYLDITVIEQEGGSADVLVGSTPIVLGSTSRGVELRTRLDGAVSTASLRVAADGTTLLAPGGRIGALLGQRDGAAGGAIETLDTFAAALIREVNMLHASGQGRVGHTSLRSAELGSATSNLNAAETGLPFAIEGGSFFIHVTNRTSGLRESYEIAVDGDAMSLDDLAGAIDGQLAGAAAEVVSGNAILFTADPGYEITFSDDTSGALAALGINAFFTGSGAADIAVSEDLQATPGLLALGAGHIAGSNDTALAIAALDEAPVASLSGRSLAAFWRDGVAALAVDQAAADASAESATLVRESLAAQALAVSGVSLDEESINLINYQRQFQAAARFISVIDEVMQTLLSIGAARA